MVKYEKPVLDVVAGFSENVYMASGNNGGGDCWVASGSSVQNWNGSHNVFEIRATHSNAYKSGDNVTFKVWAKGADEATTKALAITGISWSCQHATNVQGKYD